MDVGLGVEYKQLSRSLLLAMTEGPRHPIITSISNLLVGSPLIGSSHLLVQFLPEYPNIDIENTTLSTVVTLKLFYI